MTDPTPILEELRNELRGQRYSLEKIRERLDKLDPTDRQPATVEQAAERWKVKPATVRKWGRAGKLRINQAGLIPWVEVERFEATKKHVTCEF